MSTFAYPRFRQDVAFLETPDGVYVKAPEGPFLLRGQHAYRLVSALVPHLDGATPVEQLLDGVGERQAATVTALLSSLGDRGVVREAGAPRDGFERFERQRMLLTDLGDDGSGFDAVIGARVVVAGADPDATAVVARTLADNGVAAAVGGPDVLAPGQVTDRHLDEADLVVLLASAGPDPDVVPVSRRAVGRCAVLAVLRLGEELVVGPWQEVAGPSAVESLLLRAADNGLSAADAWWQVTAAGAAAARPWPVLPTVAAQMALGSAAFEAFRRLGGIAGPARSREVVRLDATSLEMVRETHVPHPVTAAGQAPAARPWRHAVEPAGSSDDPTDDVSADYDALATISGDVGGVVRRFLDDPAPQLPVKVAVLDAPATGVSPVVAFHVGTVLEARRAALEEAVARYALATARRLATAVPFPVGVADVTRFGHSVVDHPSAGLGRLVTVRDLAGRAELTVPAEAVLAGPWSVDRATYEPTDDDVVARRSPQRAARAALRAAIAADALRAVEAGESAMHEIAEQDLRSWATVAFLLDAARAQGLRLRVFRVVAPVPVVVVVDDASPGRGRSATAATTAAAAEAALSRAVGAVQLAGTPWSVTGSAAGPAVRTADARRAGGWSSQEDPASSLDAMLRAVHDRGRRALAADLTPPDLVGTAAVCRVLLTTG